MGHPVKIKLTNNDLLAFQLPFHYASVTYLLSLAQLWLKAKNKGALGEDRIH